MQFGQPWPDFILLELSQFSFGQHNEGFEVKKLFPGSNSMFYCKT